MKSIIVTLLLTVFAANAFAQQTLNLDEAGYLRKSKNQKTAAWIMLGGGIATSIAGIVVYTNAFNKSAANDPVTTILSFGTNVNPAGAYMWTVGILSSLGSIPLFFASSRNKNAAIRLSVKNEKITSIINRNHVTTSIPSVSLKINL